MLELSQVKDCLILNFSPVTLLWKLSPSTKCSLQVADFLEQWVHPGVSVGVEEGSWDGIRML